MHDFRAIKFRKRNVFPDLYIIILLWILIVEDHCLAQERISLARSGFFNEITPAFVKKSMQIQQPSTRPQNSYSTTPVSYSPNQYIITPKVAVSRSVTRSPRITTTTSAPARTRTQFINSISNIILSSTQKSFRTTKTPVQILVCPINVDIPLFSLPCRVEKDCRAFGPGLTCCQQRCIKGVLMPKDLVDREQTKKNEVFEIRERAPKVLNLVKTNEDTRNTKYVKSSQTAQPTRQRVRSNVIRRKLPPTPSHQPSTGKPPVSIPIAQEKYDVQVKQTQPQMHLQTQLQIQQPIQLQPHSQFQPQTIRVQPQLQFPTKMHLQNQMQLQAQQKQQQQEQYNKQQLLLMKKKIVCPGPETRIPFFAFPCGNDAMCQFFGKDHVCCKRKCIKGIPFEKLADMHAPALFGLVERTCPKEHIAEILEVKECESDRDCGSRICCQEKIIQGKIPVSYCRTPDHNIEKLPGGKKLEEPIKNFVSYMQCTPPPPAGLDKFPKPCNNTLDCFPSLCCQENGKKHCRPPKRSFIAFVADVTSKWGTAKATKKFIERITN